MEHRLRLTAPNIPGFSCADPSEYGNGELEARFAGTPTMRSPSFELDSLLEEMKS